MADNSPGRSVPYERRPEVRELHNSIGLYMTVFSELASLMRRSIHEFLAPTGEEFPPPNRLLDVMFANMTAKPLADSFYSMAREVGNLEATDVAIKNRLRRETQQHISFRNDLAHAEWSIGWENAETGGAIPPSSVRIKSVDGVPRLKDMGITTSDLYRAVRYLRVHIDQVRFVARTCRDRQRGNRDPRLADQLALVQEKGRSWVTGFGAE
ncbi:hypothetical protein RB608_22755 [Nocardioides sp. LHD-245]|uniref:hypothetical protein n=1 Tax=Nocardioides sp. LHD-245 TaxID=3051387 RepID=UPI0027DFE12A|nr:hypothetical protein [Nocardioides sp. LHD-245]